MSQTLQNYLRELFLAAGQKVFALPEFPSEIVKSSQDHFGHYQCNSAMKLASLVKENPRKIAEKLQAAITDPAIEKLEVAGPGFINITLSPKFLSQFVKAELVDEKLHVEAVKKERVVVDFSSPNIAKEMHVGHLRSTIIGDFLARIFEFLGHDVLRLNHVGDFGTSFGMLIAFMKENCASVIADASHVRLSELVTYYKAAKILFDSDLKFKKAAQLEVVALQQGESEAVKIWKVICDISRRAFEEIYALLDVHLIERGESFYNPLLAQVVADCEKKGLVTISGGAKCIYLEGFQNREGNALPLMIQKSDGGYNYDTTDLAAIYHRIVVEKADRIIYVTDSGQSTHFAQVFAAAILAGYLDPKKVRVDHVPFGLVLGPDGKKFRTRSGETERLYDLLIEAPVRAEAILAERNPEWSDEERKKTARALGIGAIKYADLASNRVSDYVFSYDRMLKFEGNTVAFVMYAYVRARSIQRKVGLDLNDIIATTDITLTHESEIALALHLARFPEVIEQIVGDLLPNRLTDYLYILAERFNLFFRDCRVEGDPAQNSRLLLTELTAKVFERGFSLLGIPRVEKM
jgi:arginyl-tRNA synthetase